MTHVTTFSQRDPRWAVEKLGTGTLSIGSAGCLLTAMASICVDFGVPTDPHRLNQWLISHGGYFRGNLFRFDSVRGLGVDLGDYVNCELVPAPVDAIMTALEGGCGVVVEVDYTPGGTLNRHWVRLVSLAPRSGWIMDPWEMAGGEMVDVKDYLAPSWDTARGIFAAAIYTRSDEMRFEALSREAAHQKALAVRVEVP